MWQSKCQASSFSWCSYCPIKRCGCGVKILSLDLSRYFQEWRSARSTTVTGFETSVIDCGVCQRRCTADGRLPHFGERHCFLTFSNFADVCLCIFSDLSMEPQREFCRLRFDGFCLAMLVTGCFCFAVWHSPVCTEAPRVTAAGSKIWSRADTSDGECRKQNWSTRGK